MQVIRLLIVYTYDGSQVFTHPDLFPHGEPAQPPPIGRALAPCQAWAHGQNVARVYKWPPGGVIARVEQVIHEANAFLASNASVQVRVLFLFHESADTQNETVIETVTNGDPPIAPITGANSLRVVPFRLTRKHATAHSEQIWEMLESIAGARQIPTFEELFDSFFREG